MPDFIGTIPVPEVSPSGTLPISVQYGFVTTTDPRIVTHTFGAGNAKREQRFKMGPDLRRFQIDQEFWEDEREALVAFWEARQGGHQPFTFNLPLPDGSTEAVTCAFADVPLLWDFVAALKTRIQLELIEVATGAGPSYPLNGSVTISDIGEWKRAGRPSGDPAAPLADALLEQQHEMIPLIRIIPREDGYPEIFLSDRRCTIDGQLYLPRLLWERCEGIGQVAVGLPGGGDDPDDVTLLFGDADRVMRDLATAVRLEMSRVEFSGYHIGTGVRMDIWAGEIQTWAANPLEFTLQCSDPIASPNLQVPDREITRKCPWAFDDGVDCPFSDSALGGTMDLVHFPTAVPESCDRGYDTANGCLAHGMKRFYGGVVAVPQAVRVKDNSTGVFGIGRAWMTSVSLIGDSVYGLPLPEIYTDIPMPVPAYLIAGRDEGDFYEALGIVGEGPITLFGKGHRLDGQLHHGYPASVLFSTPSLGLREVKGTHPAGATDFLSLDESGDQTNGDWRKVFNGSSTFLDNFSAGVAFVVLRINDPQGRQLTRLDEHSMEVFTDSGLGGWVWTAPGSRSWIEPLVNPIWVQVNRHLRTMRLKTATAAQQEAVFDVRAAIYYADICDLFVPKIVGEGDETQFKFIGRIDARRSHRQWLNDIGLNCLGYFTNSFGKLKVGIRVNSSTIAAYTAGNMLWKSLRLASHGTEFNRLTCTFADVLQNVSNGENQFVANTGRAQDDDYALELGGGVRAVYRDAQMNLVGTSNISQAQRIANTIMREEVGGVSAEERAKARRVWWGTTILGIDTEAGDITSITDDDIPGGTGEFRVYRWRLKPDWSIELEGRTTTDSMYDLVMGPKPADVVPGAIPPEGFPDPQRQAWHPYDLFPDVDDPVFGTPLTDGILRRRYFCNVGQFLNDPTGPFVEIYGRPPINKFLTNVQPPVFRTISTSATGGDLEPGVYSVSIACWRALTGWSPHSNILKVHVPAGTNTNTITVDDIVWPAGDFSDGGWALFAGKDDERLICEQTGDAIGSGDFPASIEWTGNGGPWKESTFNLPGVVNRKVVMKASAVTHSGPGVPLTVTEVGAGYFIVGALAGQTDDWTGRIVTELLDRTGYANGGFAPVRNYLVTAYTPATGRFDVTPDPQTASTGGNPEGIGMIAGNIVHIRHKAGTITADTIGDSLIDNDMLPGGLTVDDAKGESIWIIAGPGAGQRRKILSNTATVYTVDPWDPDDMPTADSIWIQMPMGWTQRAEAVVPPTPHEGNLMRLFMNIQNYADTVWAVVGLIEDRNSLETPEELLYPREILVFGGLGEYAYTIVHGKDGAVQDGETSLIQNVNDLREAAPYEVSLHATSAPITLPLKVQFTVTFPAGAPQDVLTAELELPVGQTGPVYSKAFESAVTGTWPRGTLSFMTIVQSGGVLKPVGQIVMRRVTQQ